MDLVDIVYDLAACFPTSENYRLAAQITRAVVSVPSNIAEGQARSTSKEFANFLAIAKGSLMETETLLLVATRRGYVTDIAASPALTLTTEISKMLTALRSQIIVGRRKR
ncbi:MAG: four helix bundle protein [Chloroflexi bacterium]|nr:four helix bundle protein [Chloroflexota bacterium]